MVMDNVSSVCLSSEVVAESERLLLPLFRMFDHVFLFFFLQKLAEDAFGCY